MVLVDGQAEKHSPKIPTTKVSDYIEWYEGAKRVRLSVGKDAADANGGDSARKRN
jgi:hypothetical protein